MMGAMRWTCGLLFLCVLGTIGRAQDACGDGCGEGCTEGCGDGCSDGCGCDGGAVIMTDEQSGGGDEVEVKIDPFDDLQRTDEPNRPPPVRVGTWPPPRLDEAREKERAALEAARRANPDDLAARYRLADFYLVAGWWPHAEAEYLACAEHDPEAIRPWEGLLAVYEHRTPTEDERIAEILRQLQANGGAAIPIDFGPVNRRMDWLPDGAARLKRLTHAYQELLKRRPDDIGRRRLFIEHLKVVGDHDRVREQAEILLRLLPDDPSVRYDLAEAIRRIGALKDLESEGSGAAEAAEVRRLLEENVAHAPDHAPSALRLARILHAGGEAGSAARVSELERRAFFTLFMSPMPDAVPARDDTIRLAAALAGPSVASRLWDSAMRPPNWNGDAYDFRRWLSDDQRNVFPYAPPAARARLFEQLVRRGDREAAALLVAFLWHFEDPERNWDEATKASHQEVEDAAIRSVARLGGAAYDAAARMLAAAEESHHRRRAVAMLAGIKDPRGARGLVDALAWDVDPERAYGVAAALEATANPLAVDALVAATLDAARPPARRKEAAEALAAFRDPRCVEALRRVATEVGFGLVASYGLRRLGVDADPAPFREALGAEASAREALRLLAKCDSPRTEAILLDALGLSVAVRADVVAMLRARFPESSRDRIKETLLAEARSENVDPATLDVLGEIGGEDVAEALLNLVRTTQGVVWARAARALAQTGDARGVQYFNRARIVERDPGRRSLCEQLHAEASRRQAELAKTASKG
jgi:hypothetical protein